MANFKGTGILVIPKLLKAKGGDAETKFLDKLTPAETKAYKTCIPISWVPVETAVSLSGKAAELLYPDDPRGALWRFGYERSLIQLSGVYRVLFHVLNISTIMASSALLWPAQHDKGQARIEKGENDKCAYFCVSGYPDLLPQFRKMLQGFITGVLTTGGQKNVRVELQESNPDLWKWKGIWD
jgi:hypothetical protein